MTTTLNKINDGIIDKTNIIYSEHKFNYLCSIYNIYIDNNICSLYNKLKHWYQLGLYEGYKLNTQFINIDNFINPEYHNIQLWYNLGLSEGFNYKFDNSNINIYPILTKTKKHYKFSFIKIKKPTSWSQNYERMIYKPKSLYILHKRLIHS